MFGEGFATTEYLAAALLDLAWHRLAPGEEVDDVEAFEAAALAAAGIPPTLPPRYRSAYFNHVFAGAYSAAYYSYIWSEVLDADTADWFAEHGGLRRQNGDTFARRCSRAAGPSTRWRRTAPSAGATRRSARCWCVGAWRACRPRSNGGGDLRARRVVIERGSMRTTTALRTPTARSLLPAQPVLYRGVEVPTRESRAVAVAA